MLKTRRPGPPKFSKLMVPPEFPWLSPEALAALPMPVMLLAGAQTQPVHRAIFENLCAAMPQAQQHWVENAGHGVTREQPERFNALVQSFLAALR